MEVSSNAELLVLFDVDGTLLLTNGAGRVAIRQALEAVYGTSGDMEGYNFHGKTDPQIIVELMSSTGLEEAEVRARMSEIWPVYLEILGRELETRRVENRITVLPGVADLLAALTSKTGVSLGLLTGNIEQGAKLKLAAAGVPWLFDAGAYGSDAEVRSEIARVAVERSRSAVGSAAAVLVVGDTPEDIACARDVDALALAVATGRHGTDELEEAGADAVFADFGDTESVLQCIESLTRGGDGVGETRLNGGSG